MRFKVAADDRHLRGGHTVGTEAAHGIFSTGVVAIARDDNIRKLRGQCVRNDLDFIKDLGDDGTHFFLPLPLPIPIMPMPEPIIGHCIMGIFEPICMCSIMWPIFLDCMLLIIS